MKTLHISIILMVICVLIVPSVHNVKAIPYLSPKDLYKQSEMVLYGQVLSRQDGPGPDYYYYTIKVLTYFKNQQKADFVTVAGHKPTAGLLTYPQFDVGDKDLFYIVKENHVLAISPYSTKAGEGCDIHAFLGSAPLPGEPIIRGMPSPVDITNANMTARGEFEVNTSVLVTYFMWNNYPQPRNFTVDISVINQNNNSVSFHKREILQDETCDANTALRWIFTPDKAGYYLVNATVNGEFRWGSGFRVINSSTIHELNPETGFSSTLFKTDHGVYPIQYNITNGRLVGSLVDLPAKEFIFAINATGNGKLTVELPRKIIDSTRDGKDKPYLVFVGYLETGTKRIKANEIENNNERRTLAIDFAKGDNQIGIVGTYFIENNSTSTGWNPFGTFTPLQQYKKGFDAQDIVCKQGLQLIIKAEDGSPACVKSKSVKQLVERGWTKSVLYGTLSIEDVKSITHFTVKVPSYLPSGYQFIGAQASPIDGRLLYWNKTTAEHDFAGTRQMAEGAIVISYLFTDEKSIPADQTENRTATMISLYNELIQDHREARLTHINGNLALVREGCSCLTESTAYSEKLETVIYVPLTTRIMYFDENIEYSIESLLPSSILERIAQSMK